MNPSESAALSAIVPPGANPCAQARSLDPVERHLANAIDIRVGEF